MYCNQCGKKINEGEQLCDECKKLKTGEMHDVKKEKKAKSVSIIVIISILVIVIIALAICYILKDSKSVSKNGTTAEVEKGQIIGSNGQIIETETKLSFANMKVDNEELGLSKEQQEVLRYFDNDYFPVYRCEDLQRYPKVYKGAQIEIQGTIKKILKSTDTEFEALLVLHDGYGEAPELSETKDIFIMKSKQFDDRLIEDDNVIIYGRYKDIVTCQIDGKSYTVPEITTISIVVPPERRFDVETITTVAKYIFGNDIKIRKPVDGQDFELGPNYIPEDFFYLAILDNQSNANFRAFDIHQDYGYISYNTKHNNLSDNITKRLFIAADFQHFIVSTYDIGTEHVYVEYFDRAFNKIWSREFDYTMNSITSSPMDYTANQMAFVIDNELYLLDMETGKNVIEPIIVGEKLRVVMLSDGILLIGNNNKDAIMKVDYNGKIVSKINAETDMDQIIAADVQMVNNKITIWIRGNKKNGATMQYLSKYIVLNSDGSIDMTTKDISEYEY